MLPDKPKSPELHDPDTGNEIGRAEMMDLLADEGYTADKRKGWLKGVLTKETGAKADAADPEHVKLEEEVQSILSEHVEETPGAKDGLKPDP